MSVEENKRIVLQFFEGAINKNDPELAERLADPDFVDHDPLPGEPRGRAAGRYIVEQLNRNFGSPRFSFDLLIGEGDIVAGRWKLEAIDTRGVAGREPTGKHFTEIGMAMFRVRENRIVERWAVVDRLGLLQQLGGAT
jgi:predicted ester cyclase